MRGFVKVILAVVGTMGFIPALAMAQLTFNHTTTGAVLDLNNAPEEGRDTEAVKQFLETGVNPYTEVKSCMPAAAEMYLVACSGCHGHLGEGKIGPGLADNYWTYLKNKTDKGLFETIYGGARGQMGPHWDLQLNETLLVMAWIRHLYNGPIEDAPWLTPEQQEVFVNFDPEHPHPAEAEGECEIPAQ